MRAIFGCVGGRRYIGVDGINCGIGFSKTNVSLFLVQVAFDFSKRLC